MKYEEILKVLNTPVPTREYISSIDNLTLNEVKGLLQEIVNACAWDKDNYKYVHFKEAEDFDLSVLFEIIHGLVKDEVE